VLFDETQHLFAATVRAFAREQLKPHYQRWENEPVTSDLIGEVANLGAMGLLIPAEYGGADAGYVEAGIAAEELSRGDFNANNLVQLAAIASVALRRGATSELKAEWLPQIADGSVVPSLGLTEPDVGTDAGALTTKAEHHGDTWVISGEKASITFAGYSQACLVFARTGGPGPSGISAFWVPLNDDGVTRQVYRSAGGSFTARGSLVFDEVAVPESYLVGDLNKGFALAMTSFDFNRAIIALGCIGTALESIEETVAYTSSRHTFGQPLSSRQAITQQVAEHQSQLTAARLTAYEALQLADQGESHTALAAMAKWMGPKWAAEAVHACMLLHGWAGYDKELPFEQRLRDIIGLQVGDGTGEIMKAIVARDLYGVATHR